MDQKKMIDLQYQMRQNNEELQDFLKDLEGWQDEIKEKDEKLKSEKPDRGSEVGNFWTHAHFAK